VPPTPANTLKARLLHWQEIALCLVRKWWRPIVCVSMGGSLLVNGIILPLWTKTYPDLLGLAAVCGALTPFAWLRTKEKVEGVATSPVANQPQSDIEAWT
jgi:hypothetical protein